MVKEFVGFPDWGFIQDIYREPPGDQNYNILRIKRCIEPLCKWYDQFPECSTCALDQQDPIPDCYKICRYKKKPVGKKGGPIQIVETRRRFPPGYDTPYGTILIPRGMLYFNCENDLPFWFRCGNGNGFHFHHKNGISHDDRLENRCITDIHGLIHGSQRTIKAGTNFSNLLFENGKIDESERERLVGYFDKLMSRFQDQQDSPRLWIFIHDMRAAVDAYEKFGEIPSVLVDAILSHMPERVIADLTKRGVDLKYGL